MTLDTQALVFCNLTAWRTGAIFAASGPNLLINNQYTVSSLDDKESSGIWSTQVPIAFHIASTNTNYAGLTQPALGPPAMFDRSNIVGAVRLVGGALRVVKTSRNTVESGVLRVATNPTPRNSVLGLDKLFDSTVGSKYGKRAYLASGTSTALCEV